MTLPLEKTLADVRASVAKRCGLASSGKLNLKLQPQIDEFINQAQAELYPRAYWARLLRKLAFDLADGVAAYDIPEVTRIGGIHRLTVETATTPTREFELKYDDALELNQWSQIQRSKPAFFQIIDEVIRIAPLADVTVYPRAYLYVELRPEPMVDENSRLVIDSEAVVQAATIKTRRYLGIGGDQDLERKELERYLLDLRGLVAAARSYPIASRNIDGPAYWKYPITNGYAAPYTADWNPPGSW